MEDAPTPISIEEIIIKSSKDYKIKSDNKEYIAKLILSHIIKINIQEIENNNNYSQIYYKNLSLEGFQKLNMLFRQYETLNECYECLLKFFEKDKVSISNEEEKLLIKFQINTLFGDYEEIVIHLQKKLMNQPKSDLNGKLYEEINELKNKINSLEEETKDLRNIIQTLQQENTNYKSIIESRLSKLEQKYQNTELNIDSKIISTTEEFNFLLSRLKKYFKKDITLKLIYRASKDGDEPCDFHNICDKKKNVLVLYLTTKNIKFGGFSSIGFDSSNCGKKDLNSFIFNINNKKIYEAKESNQIGCFEENGPFFGRFNAAIYMYDGVNFMTKKQDEHKTNKNIVSFEGLNEKDYEINNGEQYFNLNELEVFQIK